MSILVVGFGNILLSDEGIGVRTVEAFTERYEVPAGVEVLDGGTSGMELLDVIAGRDALIVVDAITSMQRAPGEAARLSGTDIDQLFRTRLSPHQLGLSEVLAGLQLTGESPGEVVIIGVVPANLDLGLELSHTGAQGRETALSMLVTELERHGVVCRTRSCRQAGATADAPTARSPGAALTPRDSGEESSRCA